MLNRVRKLRSCDRRRHLLPRWQLSDEKCRLRFRL